jgi:hypothetical protein
MLSRRLAQQRDLQVQCAPHLKKSVRQPHYCHTALYVLIKLHAPRHFVRGCELAKYMSNYGQKHYEAAKHLLHYLQRTGSRGITYGKSPNPLPIFTAFADSDWAMSGNRKSVSGYLIECRNGPLTWSSKQQVVIALSSYEAKYLACSHCAQQIIWLGSLFDEIGFTQLNPTPLYCDNQGTVACTHDPQAL